MSFNVGDKVKLIAGSEYVPSGFKIGDILTVKEKLDRDGEYYVQREDNALWGFVHKSRVVAAKNFKVGDKIRMLNVTTPYVSASIGDVAEIVRELNYGGSYDYDVEFTRPGGGTYNNSVGAGQIELVVPPTFKVGDKVRIKNYSGSHHKVENGLVGEIVVPYAPPAGKVWFHVPGYSSTGHGISVSIDEVELIEAPKPEIVSRDGVNSLPAGSVVLDPKGKARIRAEHHDVWTFTDKGLTPWGDYTVIHKPEVAKVDPAVELAKVLWDARFGGVVSKSGSIHTFGVNKAAYENIAKYVLDNFTAKV